MSSQVACLACGSKAGRRLVEEDQLGSADHGRGQRKPLLLATGQVLVGGSGRARQAQRG